MDALNKSERAEHIAPLLANGWEMVAGRDAFQKTFKFANFRKAFAWMTEMAIWAEKLDHHPEWSNVYRTVDVVLITHDANGLTMRDVNLAKRMDAAWKK